MNIVKIYGGLGNQFFQYAFGRALQESGKSVAYDISWYSSPKGKHPDYPRLFRLDKYPVHMDIGTLSPENANILEKRVGYNNQLFSMQVDCNFEGYWQYYSYFEKILPFLKNELQVSTEYYNDLFLKYADKIFSTESVSVHIRRGDYQLHRAGAFRDLPFKYYFNAMKEVEGDFFIFSDYLPWCKEKFKQEYFEGKITFIDIEDYLALELMRYCQKNIITNSSFSFWAAMLNVNENKMVFRPTHYLGDSEDYSDQLRYPKSWIKIHDYADNLA